MSVYVIAEAGVNHNGSLELAKELIDVASESGANAVKFQTFCTSELVAPSARKASYQMKLTPTNESQYDMIQKYELSFDDFKILSEYARSRNIDFLSTPFDSPSLDFLVDVLRLRTIKVPSGEITNIPFLLDISRVSDQIIISTGMSSLGEIERALSVLAYGFLFPNESIPSLHDLDSSYSNPLAQNYLKERVTLLHCTSEYPAPLDTVNLRVIQTLMSAFGLPVGYSDHTNGINVPIAAVAMGSCLIEKHFTLDKSLPGPDHAASLEPEELKHMCNGIRQIEISLGSALKCPSSAEYINRTATRKSVVASQAINEGDLFSLDNLSCKRPGSGLAPIALWSLVGTRSRKSYSTNDFIES